MKVTITGLNTPELDKAVGDVINTVCESDIIAYGVADAFPEGLTDQQMGDVEKLIRGMLVTDAIYGVKWGQTFYFGDVDMLDMFNNYLDDEGTITMLIGPDDPTVEELYAMFTKVNSDCAASNEPEVPFSDQRYYATQIQNMYDVSLKQAEELAVALSNYKGEN